MIHECGMARLSVCHCGSCSCDTLGRAQMENLPSANQNGLKRFKPTSANAGPCTVWPLVGCETTGAKVENDFSKSTKTNQTIHTYWVMWFVLCFNWIMKHQHSPANEWTRVVQRTTFLRCGQIPKPLQHPTTSRVRVESEVTERPGQLSLTTQGTAKLVWQGEKAVAVASLPILWNKHKQTESNQSVHSNTYQKNWFTTWFTWDWVAWNKWHILPEAKVETAPESRKPCKVPLASRRRVQHRCENGHVPKSDAITW